MDESNGLYCRFWKRIFDVIFGVVAFIVLATPMGILAVVILITEGRPVIFKQVRAGKKGEKFEILKFRTMVQNAEKIGPKFTSLNDNRITKIGEILRRTSLDELPQIINVIKGDMSFIGYRPDVFKENNSCNARKYTLRPGITGYAQVNGRSDLTLEQSEYWEEKYVEDVSFTTDLKILCKTFKVVLRKGGAN